MVDRHHRRSTILTSAARLFAEKGTDATTVREIAESVGMLSGSLYHHFPSKDAIVDEVVTSYVQDLLSGYRRVLAQALDPRETVQGLIEASVDAIAQHPHATDVYRMEMRRLDEPARFAALHAAATDVQQIWLTVLDAGQGAGQFRSDVPTWLVYRLVRDALFHSAHVRPRQSHRLAAMFSGLVLDGAGARRPALVAAGA